ncbi:chorismate-binding protein [Candidatus Pacearchaeota archaeon]|nr:chorismate-binding protein [Candidatus Pacearchaeota archaeon]
MELIDYERAVLHAPLGSIIPIRERVSTALDDPSAYFSKLSDYGRKKDSLLFESGVVVEPYGKRSMGMVSPCLRLTGRGEEFTIQALNERGTRFLRFLTPKLSFCDEVRAHDDLIEGVLKPVRGFFSETERLTLKTHMEIIRAVGFSFKPIPSYVRTHPTLYAGHYGGLMGALAYDLIDQFEELPASQQDSLKDPDYDLYYADTVFTYDHTTKVLELISNALITDEKRQRVYGECLENILRMKDALRIPNPLPHSFAPQKSSVTSDISRREFCELVDKLKEHIVKGDVFQAVLSRTVSTDYAGEPFGIYRALRELNPSPYMFFIHNRNGVLLGASPERCVSVTKDSLGHRRIEIHPIAGTKPRGFIENRLDPDLDNRYEAELKLDPKELAEHTMLVDLARNDVARLSLPGTRRVDAPYVVVKYSHVQHLVSKVSGILRPEYDALHAYLASMNMGTLTGAPKVEAMKLLRKYEKSRRGFYGGSVFFLTPDGDFDSAITIRSIRLKQGRAYLRAGAGIVYDSVPEREFEETERKIAACLRALRIAGGVT